VAGTRPAEAYPVGAYLQQTLAMHSAARYVLFPIFLLALSVSAAAGELSREFNIKQGGSVEIKNPHGRVAVTMTMSGVDERRVTLTASSASALDTKEIESEVAGDRAIVNVSTREFGKRIDLVLTVPARAKLKIVTDAGAIDVGGNFASIVAQSGTGTISVDVPPDDLRYEFNWTESRPRYLADFPIGDVKERSGGRFVIKGRVGEKEVKAKKTKTNDSGATDDAEPLAENIGDTIPKSVSLDLTTARGIVLLNVPAGEVMADLRQRPLTEAAKAIIRSGDSLLMDAIRRATPKYFGDYSRTLPPVNLEPRFATGRVRSAGTASQLKTASVRVTDVLNRAVDNLDPKDFQIIENGVQRDVVSVNRSTAPFNLVLLLDVSGSVENYVNFIRKAARNFVETVGDQDKVSIVIFNEDVKVLSKFTKDKAKLSESLDTFDAGGGTAYYDALAYTISDTLRPLKGERTAIVILTDGDDNRSFLTFDTLAGSIQESGALIYPLYVPSGLIAMAAQNINTDIDPMRRKYMSLTAKSEGEGEKLAKLSGGVYYPISQIDQIQKAYKDIVVQLRSAYDITFRSEAVEIGSGSSPRLKVKLKRDDLYATIIAVTPAK
jgi:VWFA-related protein